MVLKISKLHFVYVFLYQSYVYNIRRQELHKSDFNTFYPSSELKNASVF